MTDDHSPTPDMPRDSLPRRRLLKGGVATLLASLLARPANAAPTGSEERQPKKEKTMSATPPHPPHDFAQDSASLLDRYAIGEVIMRERLAREMHSWDEEEACFHPDAMVEVSWFKGSAAEFVNVGRRAATPGGARNAVFFDSMSPPVVWLNQDRAIADTACAVHAFVMLDGVEVSMTSYTRLLWRLHKQGKQWLIAGLRGIYIRDTLDACNPAQPPKIDLTKLAQFRQSYRHLAYIMSASGRTLGDDLPGMDRPDIVATMRDDARKWLTEAG